MAVFLIGELRQEMLRQAVIGDFREKDWAYKQASDHNDSTHFRERMEKRRELIPVTSHIVVQPTEK